MNKQVILNEMFATHVRSLGEKALAFPWDDRFAYANWLAQTYYYVAHTTTLVCLVAAKFGAKNRDGHYHALHHLTDERGHDQMALQDLESLGFTLHDFPELPETALFYQNQYYMIQHEGAFAHLGYSLCLEGLASIHGPELNRRAQKAHGKKACLFLDTHATLDQDHYREGASELHKLSEADAQSVVKNLEQSAWLYGLMLERCARDARQRALPKAG